MNTWINLFIYKNRIVSLDISYSDIGIYLYFRFKIPRNYKKTRMPKTIEDLEYLLYRAKLNVVTNGFESIYEFWDPWLIENPDDSRLSYCGYTDRCEKKYEIELNNKFLEGLIGTEEGKFDYKLKQSIRKYKNIVILGRKDKGRRYFKKEKREDPFKYQKYKFSKI